MGKLIHAIDVASYQPRDLRHLINRADAEHVVVRLYLPEEVVPQDHTRQQISSARQCGASVSGYVWCYYSSDPRKTVRDAVSLVRSCDLELPVLWFDCENYALRGVVEDPGPNAVWLRAASDECRGLGVRPGIYTGRWWWQARIGESAEFADLPLWVAQYDEVPNLEQVTLFGGWTVAAGKQWTTTGETLDRDVFDEHVCARGRTIAELEAENPSIRAQLQEWQLARRQNGEDPYEYAAFRQHLRGLGAPDSGVWEFAEFSPRGIRTLKALNLSIGRQLAEWQQARRQNHEEPYDYSAFRRHLQALGAPDPGPDEFVGFRP